MFCILGDNFLRQSGDTLKLAATQVLCWEMTDNNIINKDMDTLTNPSQIELLHKEYIIKKKILEDIKKKSLIDKYGSNTINNNIILDPRLKLGQTESYIEYNSNGKVIKNHIKTEIKTKYDENIYINNHTEVWGSYYHRTRRLWGFECCHSLVKNSYCVGIKGKESNDLTNNSGMDKLQAKHMIESIQMKEPIKSSIVIANSNSNSNVNMNSTKGDITKRSDLYGNANIDTKYDETKLKEALKKQQLQEIEGKNNENESNNNNKNDKKRSYNSTKDVNVTAEDMEAYRMSKSRREDPMEKYLTEHNPEDD